jgi:phosphoglycolate phosphatase
MHKKNWLIFDFDGVIVDSFDAAYKLSQHLLKTKDEASYRALFQGSIADVLKQKLSPRVITRFFQQFNRAMLAQPIVPGMADLITAVSKDYNLAVVSSSTTGGIKRFLAEFEIEQYFTEILGYDVAGNKSDKIKDLMNTYHFSNKECIMITDTVGDVREAAIVSVPSIAVSWGYENEHDFKSIKTHKVVHTPLELQQAIDSYFL